MKRILIPEDIPSHNKGEAALLYGMLESLRRLGSIEVNLFSLNPIEDKANYGNVVKIFDARGITPAHMISGQGSILKKGINYVIFLGKNIAFLLLFKMIGKQALKIMRREIWSAYLDADLVIMGHDSFFAPLYHGPLLLLFKALHKPAVIYAATIIPPSHAGSSVKSKIAMWLTREALKKAALITLRERQTYEYLIQLGLGDNASKIHICADLAFLMPPVPKSRVTDILNNEGIAGDGPMVGMAISMRKIDFAFPESGLLEDRRSKVLSQIVDVVNYITGMLKAKVVFVPHSIGPTRKLDDRIPARQIFEKAQHRDRITVMHKEYSPRELKGIAGAFDITVGMRLHFAIDAVCMAIPSILITHKGDFRCHGIMGDMLGLKEYLYNIESISAKELIPMIKKLWDNRLHVQDKLKETLPTLKDEALRNGQLVSKVLVGTL